MVSLLTTDASAVGASVRSSVVSASMLMYFAEPSATTSATPSGADVQLPAPSVKPVVLPFVIAVPAGRDEKPTSNQSFVSGGIAAGPAA